MPGWHALVNIMWRDGVREYGGGNLRLLCKSAFPGSTVEVAVDHFESHSAVTMQLIVLGHCVVVIGRPENTARFARCITKAWVCRPAQQEEHVSCITQISL